MGLHEFIEKVFVKNFLNNIILFKFFKNRKEFGDFGEKIACKYLEKKNLKLIEKNFRFQRCEVDLIFLEKKTKTLIFVEVKSRKNKAFGEPEESVNYFKQRNIKKASQGFILKMKEYENYDFRFDTLSVMFEKNNEYRINHIECAF
jgi:putative endonuclease